MNLRMAAIVLSCCSLVWADFSYEQTSQVTGGAIAGMLRAAGTFSKAAREPQKMQIMVKDDRMATVSPSRISIIDLNQETFTDVDLEKKTYASITFAQMSEAIKKMSERMNRTKNPDATMQFKADVKNTGATRMVQGLETKQTVVTLTVEGTDNKTGNAGAMNFTMDMWLAPDIAGYAEVRAFYHRMAEKLAWTPGSGMLAGMMAQYGKGMSELAKEMSKIEGVPVVQITRIGGTGDAAPSGSQTSNTAPQEPQPTVQEAAGDVAAAAALGRLGRLGGFGRKKKTEEQKPAQETAAPSSASSGTMMEMTTELTGFSDKVDPSKFEIPTGFKQVDHEMLKALK